MVAILFLLLNTSSEQELQKDTFPITLSQSSPLLLNRDVSISASECNTKVYTKINVCMCIYIHTYTEERFLCSFSCSVLKLIQCLLLCCQSCHQKNRENLTIRYYTKQCPKNIECFLGRDGLTLESKVVESLHRMTEMAQPCKIIIPSACNRFKQEIYKLSTASCRKTFSWTVVFGFL